MRTDILAAARLQAFCQGKNIVDILYKDQFLIGLTDMVQSRLNHIYYGCGSDCNIETYNLNKYHVYLQRVIRSILLFQ